MEEGYGREGEREEKEMEEGEMGGGNRERKKGGMKLQLSFPLVGGNN